jgi:hypothetical protein
MTENFKYKRDLIEWRRNTVLQRLAQGATQSQIAQELQLHPSTISLDVQFLKEKSKKELENHIQDVIPFRHAQCLEGMRQILWETNKIISKENLDDKTKIQCLTLLASVYRTIADMTAEGSIVEQAIKKVRIIQSQSQASSNAGLHSNEEHIGEEEEDRAEKIEEEGPDPEE